MRGFVDVTKVKFRKSNVNKQNLKKKKIFRRFQTYFRLKMLRSLVSTTSVMSRSFCKRLCSTETLKPSFDTQPNNEDTTDSASEGFETLLRKSAFIQMGDPVGKVILSNQTDTHSIIICQMNFQQVVGKIYHVVDDDLYIDFGGKV